jgi:hypothetical protein
LGQPSGYTAKHCSKSILKTQVQTNNALLWSPTPINSIHILKTQVQTMQIPLRSTCQKANLEPVSS